MVLQSWLAFPSIKVDGGLTGLRGPSCPLRLKRGGEDGVLSATCCSLLLSSAMRADWSLTARLDEHRHINYPSKLARFTCYGSGWRRFRDLRWMHGPVVVVAILTRQTDRSLCNRLPGTRPFPSWRWRDAMFEGPFGRSPGRIKFAEPSNDRAVRFIQRWSRRRPSAFCAPFWRARWASKGSNLDHR